MIAFDEAGPDANRPDFLRGRQHTALLGDELVAANRWSSVVLESHGVERAELFDRANEITGLQAFRESFNDIPTWHGTPRKITDLWSVNTDRRSKSQLAACREFG